MHVSLTLEHEDIWGIKRARPTECEPSPRLCKEVQGGAGAHLPLPSPHPAEETQRIIAARGKLAGFGKRPGVWSPQCPSAKKLVAQESGRADSTPGQSSPGGFRCQRGPGWGQQQREDFEDQVGGTRLRECGDLERKEDPFLTGTGTAPEVSVRTRKATGRTQPLWPSAVWPRCGGWELSRGPPAPLGSLTGRNDTGQRAVAPPLPSGPGAPVLLPWAPLPGCSFSGSMLLPLSAVSCAPVACACSRTPRAILTG